MKKTVLVTGGAGFIGSHTTVELVEAGYRVVVVDDLSNSEMAAVENVRKITDADIPFHRVDCCDAAALDAVFAAEHPHAVIHFAAFKAVGESVGEPLKYYRNNLLSLLNVLQSMRTHMVGGIVFSSSATVYGQPDTLPATEQSPRKAAASPYGATKQMSEDILADCVRAYEGMRCIALRYFNPIGAHPSALIGELPKGVPSNLVPFITQTAAGIRAELSVFGGDYNTEDGSALRDYIDVVDLARAHVHAVARLMGSTGANYETFNIGTGIPVSVLELVHEFERVNGVQVPHKVVGRREGDAEAVWADTRLANEVLGWHATRTLPETLAAAWKWQQTL